MKATYDQLRLMMLRPAVHSGEEIEFTVRFKNAYLLRTRHSDASALDMKCGDTVSLYGRVCFDDNADAFEIATVYMCGDTLTEFIEAFGTEKIFASVTMKAEFAYAEVSEEDFFSGDSTKEIIAFRLKEFLSYTKETEENEAA